MLSIQLKTRNENKTTTRQLTDTLKALFAKAQQHAEAEVAVGRLVEVFQSPHMRSLRFQPLTNYTQAVSATFTQL